ncbi:MAG: ATP-dependent DNA helicase RecG, partial [Acidimicrobiia bacterium]
MPRTLPELHGYPVTVLKGVGPAAAQKLEHFGVQSVLDLLTHYPRNYIDRTNQVSVRELKLGDEAMIVAAVRRVTSRRTRNGKTMVEVTVHDGTAHLPITFFNQAWRAKQLTVGRTAVFFGKVEMFRGERKMTNPVVDLVGDKTGRIIPIYQQSEKVQLTTWEVGEWVEEALKRAVDFADPLLVAGDDHVLDRLDLVDRTTAFRNIHAPETWGAKEAARKRLAFDELLRLQVTLVLRKRAYEREAKAIPHVVEGDLVRQFHSRLPFPLTGAQVRAIAEINADLAGRYPMHRLLQGDVGSGKTIVAVSALLVAVQGGHQGALMAPTEVLAEQHYLNVRELLAGMTIEDAGGASLFADRPVRVELLTNRTTATERRRIHELLLAGDVDILIGTHALLTETVQFKSLGVVVIDEQHRFGVEQRAALRGKGDDPDVLVMTATPIPRTAAMTVYGDLDVTVLDELPPGRKPIKTVWTRDEAKVWSLVRSEVEAGRQAYVVCPLIEESEKIEAKSAEDEFERLQATELEGLRLALLHGRMKPSEKEGVMQSFRAGKVDVLVSTTVIEVGVDVPNATVMVIESAERFGIAQLHQLRGRVGRGGDESF